MKRSALPLVLGMYGRVRRWRVMTDNGTGYRSHLFRQACQALGLRRTQMPWRANQTTARARKRAQLPQASSSSTAT